MCNSPVWGDVPTWIGAVGAIGAVVWAVFLYAGSLQDRKRAQARLLAPVGGAVPVQVLPGAPLELESSGASDLLGIGPDRRGIVIAEAYMAKVRLVSTSEETFSDVRATLILNSGAEVDFTLPFGEVAPHEEKIHTNYFHPGEIAGPMKVRLQFQDANGNRWERINGEPVRSIRHTRKASTPSRARSGGNVSAWMKVWGKMPFGRAGKTSQGPE